MRIALFQPDIPQNAGAALRLAACLGVGADLIEPAGFVLSERRFRRAGMDYIDRAALTRHASWEAFIAPPGPAGRLVLLTTRATQSHIDFAFASDDTLLVGRESGGVPDEVHRRADARIRVPMQDGARSLNVVTALAVVLGEALRQTNGFPAGGTRPAST